jgi:hypothetical protein
MDLSRQLRCLRVCVGVGDPDQDDEANPDRGHGLTVDADGRSAYSLHERSHRTTLSSQAPSPAGGAAVLIVALPPGCCRRGGFVVSAHDLPYLLPFPPRGLDEVYP